MNTNMTQQDHELLSQYLDGELPAPLAQEMRQRLLAEPELRAGFERLKSVNNQVRDTFNVMGADEVPAHIERMVQDLEVPAGRGFQGRRAGWGLAVAASVLAATGVLFNLGDSGQNADHMAQVKRHDSLLSPVLDQSPSRGEGWVSLDDETRVRPLLSFPNMEGSWCREYLLTGERGEWRGVACHEDGQWITAVLTPETASQTMSEYRPAGSKSSDEVASFIDATSADIPISPAQEADLIARGWKKPPAGIRSANSGRAH